MEAKAKILVVDDEEIVLLSVKKALRKDGYDIDLAGGADEALKLLANNQYDVIVTDLMMPGMDGLELLDQTKQSHPGVRTVVITGYATMSIAMKAIRKGAFDFIAKPFTKNEIRSSVSRAARHGYLELPEFVEKIPESKPMTDILQPGNLLTLRGISWALVEPEGMVKIGADPGFVKGIVEIETIETAEIQEHLSQGIPCARIVDSEGMTHALWSPISGRVVSINTEVIENPTLLLKDAKDKGWLLTVDLSPINNEIRNLNLN